MAIGAAVANLWSPVRAAAPVIRMDVWSWGRNNVGELAAVPPSHTVPGPIHAPNTWISVAAGDQHALALTLAGDVWAWGDNSQGQLGDGTTSGSMLPVQVHGLTGVTLIAAGTGHSLAYRASDGTLWAWGSNSNGQLGLPTTTARSKVPVEVSGLPTLTSIGAGASHSVALGSNGTVYTWGDNSSGQLGLGDLDDRSAPVAVNLAPALAVAAGTSHTLAVTASDGQVWAWGSNAFGQLGSGVQGAPGQSFPNPEPVLGVTGAVQVAAGGLHSLARTASGSVWAWGYNTEGQVGNGDVTPANIGVLSAVLLTGISGVASIAAGGLSSIALTSSGQVWTWGTNQFGTCGVNDRVDRHVPAQAVGISGATAVAVGGKFALAVAPERPTSRVIVLGDAGVDTSVPVARPAVTPLDGLSDVVSLAAGWHHLLVLDGQHRVWSWGDDTEGQLGTAATSSDPASQVTLPLDGAAGFVQVEARADSSFALRSDGAVFAWGDNSYGQLGTGSTEPVTGPTRISGLGGIQAIAAGERHAIALDQNAGIWAWGENLHGELGTAESSDVNPTPTMVANLFGTTEIAAGGFHNLALDLTGAVYAWGSGFMGQLGTGRLLDGTVPTAIPALGRVSSVSAGRYHSLAVLAGGALAAFGNATFAELGSGTPPGAFTPVTPATSVPVILAAAGDYHSIALGYDGSVYGWGDDSRGQLGLGGLDVPHLVPIPALSTAPAAVTAAAGLTFTALGVP